ncbi:MAG: hypothetical protein M3460_01880 [Actinomycetota bacterium]|nr:hypothetical protein [Actinomycetota bacterium]
MATVVRKAFDKAQLFQMLTSHQDYFDRQIARRWTTWARPLVELLRGSQQRGEIRADQPTEWLVDVLFWTVQGIAMSSTPPRRRDPADMVLPLFLDGARPR